jgi:hypothetical protein
MRAGRPMRILIALALLSSVPAVSAAQAPPDLSATVSRSTIALGESVTLQIIVRAGGASDPQFPVPAGLEILSTGRLQNFSWVNGRSTTETVFRYDLGANAAGRYTVGPFRVTAGGRTLTAPTLTLTVTAASTRLSAGDGGGGAGPASLIVNVEPSRPYVGQPILLRVRLVQRAPLSEDPSYVPPPTPGFWAEGFSRPESFFAAEGTRRVLVTETRARLYPLAPGTASIGEAAAALALAGSGDDPSLWIGGRVPRREVVVRSTPVKVSVRPLPPGAPGGFDGAVGVFEVSWSIDRASTARDVPASARLEVRGVGNLPLLHVPKLESDAVEVFSGTVEDSLAAPGTSTPGRRRFQWTVLPRREGQIEIEPPQFVWFDPAAGAYRRANLAPATLEVTPPLNTASGGEESFPRVFQEHPLPAPGSRPAQPWAFAIAGLALGAALVLWRRAARSGAGEPERAQQREWLRAVGLARGGDFWRIAEEASVWLESRGRPVKNLRRQIAASRYGGEAADPESVRRNLIEHLSQALAEARSPLPTRVAAVTLVLAAIALVVLFAPHPGEERAKGQGDAAARRGDVAAACSGWRARWREGDHRSPLAARLAWCEVRAGNVAPATVWVLAGERDEPRDPALAWVGERVREGGGMIGVERVRLPVRSLEWALLALGFGIAAGALWPRRVRAALALVIAIGCALARPVETAVARRSDVAVVREPIALDGTGTELEPGQVVHILERAEDRMRVRAGKAVFGWLPAHALYGLEDLP